MYLTLKEELWKYNDKKKKNNMFLITKENWSIFIKK